MNFDEMRPMKCGRLDWIGCIFRLVIIWNTFFRRFVCVSNLNFKEAIWTEQTSKTTKDKKEKKRSNRSRLLRFPLLIRLLASFSVFFLLVHFLHATFLQLNLILWCIFVQNPKKIPTNNETKLKKTKKMATRRKRKYPKQR